MRTHIEQFEDTEDSSMRIPIEQYEAREERPISQASFWHFLGLFWHALGLFLALSTSLLVSFLALSRSLLACATASSRSRGRAGRMRTHI